jgi:hypothetical protein
MNREDILTFIVGSAWVIFCLWLFVKFFQSVPVWYSCHNADYQQAKDKQTAQALCNGKIQSFSYDHLGQLRVVCAEK